MSIRFPKANKYFPKDTYMIFSTQSAGPDSNFYFLFNTPEISGEPSPEKIRLNEKIADFKWDKNFLKNINERRGNLIKDAQSNGFKSIGFTAHCPWRLIIGLGGTHPQETSMTLHHIYGIPYIPGSAVKGVTKHYAVITLADKNKENFKTKEDDDGFANAVKRISKAIEEGKDIIDLPPDDRIIFRNLITIFGTQKQAGKVIFIDAYPVDDIKLKIDIMNPHYPDYYSRNQPPADWQNPNPIKFLTVEKTKFEFNLLSREKDLLSTASNLLKKALENFGIGAKTSLGYGIFIESTQC